MAGAGVSAGLSVVILSFGMDGSAGLFWQATTIKITKEAKTESLIIFIKKICKKLQRKDIISGFAKFTSATQLFP